MDDKTNNPDPETKFPVLNVRTVCYIKPLIKNPNVVVGDFTYFSDDKNPEDFEQHITHFYDFYDDKLIIGKFCQIAKGVTFMMNGANHKMNAFSTYPFYIFEGWGASAPSINEFPLKGDTIIGNDVWIGENATILAGVKIGDGAIIGAQSIVASDVEPYTIVGGNPAKPIRKRFEKETIDFLLNLEWWDWSIEKIKQSIDVLSNADIEKLKAIE
ncbi:MAG: CatB-related O-acetyltransferase [Prevotella sp.]|jgi:virginiamycin A acetyltransferase|nr:CatB-related O-acetyltransferase [Prevotella sp.]